MLVVRGFFRFLPGVLAIVGPLVHFSAAAQVVPPQPLVIEQPDPPTNRFGMPSEGWVIVRYSVLADGSTDNVTVFEKMPPMLIDRDAVDAVESWSFEPATADGTPIDWHNNEAVIVFDVDGAPPVPSPPFLTAWREVQTELTEGDPEKALRSSRNMHPIRLAEIGLAQMQLATIDVKLGNNHAALKAIRRVTDPAIPALSADDLTGALQYRNALELQLGDVMAALDTFARRTEMGALPEGDPVAAAMPAVEKALGDGNAIAISAMILDDVWRHPLSRRTFAISDLDGSIDAINVECNRRVAELEYAADAEWTLPASWGECTVFVEGKDETTFRFFEFP